MVNTSHIINTIIHGICMKALLNKCISLFFKAFQLTVNMFTTVKALTHQKYLYVLQNDVVCEQQYRNFMTTICTE